MIIMQYIKTDRILTKDLSREITLEYAVQNLYKIRLTTSEKLLDRYLIDTYKCSLRTACESIIKNCSICFNESEDKMFILFNDKKYDKLASVITYGIGAIQGSSILREIFGDSNRRV